MSRITRPNLSGRFRPLRISGEAVWIERQLSIADLSDHSPEGRQGFAKEDCFRAPHRGARKCVQSPYADVHVPLAKR